ncbi:MAG: hypothetical protein GY711_04215 [bacterium]|nr:hypothetical protein [bacterium]
MMRFGVVQLAGLGGIVFCVSWWMMSPTREADEPVAAPSIEGRGGESNGPDALVSSDVHSRPSGTDSHPATPINVDEIDDPLTALQAIAWKEVAEGDVPPEQWRRLSALAGKHLIMERVGHLAKRMTEDPPRDPIVARILASPKIAADADAVARVSKVEQSFEKDIRYIEGLIYKELPVIAERLWEEGRYTTSLADKDEESAEQASPTDSYFTFSTGSPHMGTITLRVGEGDSAQLDHLLVMRDELRTRLEKELATTLLADEED